MRQQQLTINPLLKSLGEDVMGFLNEIQLQYPESISFASGRPDERYFEIENFASFVNVFIDSLAVLQNKGRTEILNQLGQYNRTKGIINEHVIKFLKNDEGITVDANDTVIAVGTQEAISIAVLTLCDRLNEVIIVENPTYVGLTHFSILAGYNISPVSVYQDGISIEALEEQILYYKGQGKRVKLVYVIPDYQNPTGCSMPLDNRYRLLELADKYDFLILEDNAYGEFSYEGGRNPPIKALDKDRRVIYLRSFSKTLYPSLRLSVMVADQIINNDGEILKLSDLMAKTKGYTSVNTPAIDQAILGGMLIKNEFSLRILNRPKIEAMKKKRDCLVQALYQFLDLEKAPWATGITWNIPQGGFFITINIPFEVDKKDVIYCSEHYSVIFTPMSFFYLTEGGGKEIRLAFSNISEHDINEGIKRLSLYFKNKILKKA